MLPFDCLVAHEAVMQIYDPYHICQVVLVPEPILFINGDTCYFGCQWPISPVLKNVYKVTGYVNKQLFRFAVSTLKVICQCCVRTWP